MSKLFKFMVLGISAALLGLAPAAALGQSTDALDLLTENDDAEEIQYGWFQSLVGALTFSQSHFENWAGGGTNALTWNLLALYNVDEIRERREWRTELELQFGQTKPGENDMRKTQDRIRLMSVHAWTKRWVLDPFVSVEAITQFANGHQYPDADAPNFKLLTSKFMNPFNLNATVGLMKTFMPGFSTRLGPGVQCTFVTDDSLAWVRHPEWGIDINYTDDPATAQIEKSRVNGGLEWYTDFDRGFAEDKYRVKSYLRLFSKFEDMSKVDIFWNAKIAANIISIIGVMLELEVIYDEDVIKRTQFRDNLSIGITHKFL